MRVLIASQAERTHFLGLVPVAWALRAAGHDVLVATQPALVDAVAAAGLPVAAAGRDSDFWRVARVFHSDGSAIPPLGLGGEPGWDHLLSEYRRVVPWWWRLGNEPMLTDLVALCRQWRPDLVVWGAVTFAGAVAARAVGAAHVRFLFGSDLTGRLRREFLAARPAPDAEDPLAAWLGACARRHGTDFHEELTGGQASIGFLPGPLRIAGSAEPLLPVRYVPYNGRAVVPDWLRVPPERPRVALSLGTSAVERFGSYAVRLPELLAALGEVDAEVVVTGAPPGPVPANVRAVAFVPLDALAATCSVVVNHGGPGTLCTALVHGVPQLLLPAMYDEPLLAGLLERTGAGLALPADQVTPTAVAQRTAALLTDPAYRRAAGRLRAEALAMPAPDRLVDRLEALVAGRAAPAAAPGRPG